MYVCSVQDCAFVSSYLLCVCVGVCLTERCTVGAVGAIHKCVLGVPGVLAEALDHSVIAEIISLLEKITLLLLGVLYGDQNMEDKGTLTATVLLPPIRLS